MKNNILDICESKDINLSRLIKDTGLARSHVYSIVRGNIIPTIRTAGIISSALGSTLEQVFPEEIIEKGGKENE